MTTLFTKERFRKMEWAERNWDELSFRTDYSGRAMYGRTCVGFVLGRYCYADLDSILGYIGDYESDSEWTDELRETACFDNMGLGTIIYWPHLEPKWERELSESY